MLIKYSINVMVFLSWSYGSWNYNYLCNQCLSPLKLWIWIWISIRTRCTTLCDKVCQLLATGLWFSPGTPVSSTNKTDRHHITEILLKVALNTINQTSKQTTPFLFQLKNKCKTVMIRPQQDDFPFIPFFLDNEFSLIFQKDGRVIYLSVSL